MALNGAKSTSKGKAMNRCIIFAGEVYYSIGGACDIVSTKNKLDEANTFAKNLNYWRAKNTQINKI